jgi:TRAP-type uncharacterized transport system substrate-binding protein
MEHRRRSESGNTVDRRQFLRVAAAMGGAMVLGGPESIWAQGKKSISVATGGMGGVYYPLGGAIAAVITKNAY